MSALFESLRDGLNLRWYKDWEVFDQRLAALVQTGQARRTQQIRVVYSRYEDWYVDPASGEFYVYLPLGDRNLPSWEKVDPFAEPDEPVDDPKCINTNGLRAIQQGEMNEAHAGSVRTMMRFCAEGGQVEILAEAVEMKDGSMESRYRDHLSGDVYRLVEDPARSKFVWERVSEAPKQLVM